MDKKQIVLIPVYQPKPVFVQLVQDIQKAGYLTVVVNDGSGEEYEELFCQAKPFVTLLGYSQNQGKGYALKTGLKYIYEQYKDNCRVATMDADGQHKIKDMEKLFPLVENNPDRLVIGSRGLEKNVPLRSRFGNGVTRWVYRISTGLRVHDTQSGLRAFDGKLIPKFLEIPGERYEYEMNVLLICAKDHIPMTEKEIETVYYDGNAGSHFNTIKDSYRIYKEILKFSASSFLGFLVDYGMYGVLSFATAGLPTTMGLCLSNVGARVVSASVNYTVNRKLVFKSDAQIAKSAIQYFSLAVAILIGNTAFLELFAGVLGMNRFLAKIITELVFFVLSWLVQHKIIFRRKEVVS